MAGCLKKNVILSSLAISICFNDLDGNNLGPEGAKSIAEILKVNKRLSILYLGYNRTYAEGAQYISEGLKANTKLTALYFG